VLACLLLRRSRSEAGASELAALAQDFSPRFEVVAPGVVIVDVDGLDRLIGDADAVGAAMARLAHARALPVTVTLAPTRTAALLLALAGCSAVQRSAGAQPRSSAGTEGDGDDAWEPPAYRRVGAADMAAALEGLPVSLLATLGELESETNPVASTPTRAARSTRRTRGSGRNYRLAPSPRHVEAPSRTSRDTSSDDLLQTLHRWGVTTLGAFAALPPIDLFERLGTAGLAWQAVARGEDARPLVRTTLEEPFEAFAPLEWPVDTLEPLSFVLSGLLEPLCLRLERAERGVAALQTILQLVTRTLHVRRLELPAPMRDAKVLRTLILLDLESHPPDAGIDRVTLAIEPTPERIVQHSLLTRARPSPEQVATLVARLTAVLGEGRVGAPALVDSHASAAFALRPFDGDAVASMAEPVTVMPATSVSASRAHLTMASSRPQTGYVLRRFRHLLPVRVERARGRPVHVIVPSGGVPIGQLRGGRILQAAGPWRTSGAWWTNVSATREPDGSPWDCDEWDVVVASGAALRLSRHRATGQWYVDGVLD
jgi:protein ImuB